MFILERSCESVEHSTSISSALVGGSTWIIVILVIFAVGLNKESFCRFWDCIQVLHFRLSCWLWWHISIIWRKVLCKILKKVFIYYLLRDLMLIWFKTSILCHSNVNLKECSRSVAYGIFFVFQWKL